MSDRLHRYRGKIQRYMQVAKKSACNSEFPDYRHGAVLVRGGSVINISYNKDKFCSFGHRFRSKTEGKATLHAELGAILGMDRSITDGATIYVARVGKENNFKLSKPCDMCEAALRYVGIKRVVYTVDNNIVGSYKL